MLDAGDRSSPDDTRDVFRSLFPGLKVVVKNVYELKRKPGEENEDPQCREVTRCSVAFTIPITQNTGLVQTGFRTVSAPTRRSHKFVAWAP